MCGVFIALPEAAKYLDAEDRWGKNPILEAEREVSVFTRTTTLIHSMQVKLCVGGCMRASRISSSIELSASASV